MAAGGGTVAARYARPAPESVAPKMAASSGNTRPAGSGRFIVLFMRESILRSINWFSVLPPAATNPAPTRVWKRIRASALVPAASK